MVNGDQVKIRDIRAARQQRLIQEQQRMIITPQQRTQQLEQTLPGLSKVKDTARINRVIKQLRFFDTRIANFELKRVLAEEERQRVKTGTLSPEKKQSTLRRIQRSIDRQGRLISNAQARFEGVPTERGLRIAKEQAEKKAITETKRKVFGVKGDFVTVRTREGFKRVPLSAVTITGEFKDVSLRPGERLSSATRKEIVKSLQRRIKEKGGLKGVEIKVTPRGFRVTTPKRKKIFEPGIIADIPREALFTPGFERKIAPTPKPRLESIISTLAKTGKEVTFKGGIITATDLERGRKEIINLSRIGREVIVKVPAEARVQPLFAERELVPRKTPAQEIFEGIKTGAMVLTEPFKLGAEIIDKGLREAQKQFEKIGERFPISKVIPRAAQFVLREPLRFAAKEIGEPLLIGAARIEREIARRRGFEEPISISEFGVGALSTAQLFALETREAGRGLIQTVKDPFGTAVQIGRDIVTKPSRTLGELFTTGVIFEGVRRGVKRPFRAFKFERSIRKFEKGIPKFTEAEVRGRLAVGGIRTPGSIRIPKGEIQTTFETKLEVLLEEAVKRRIISERAAKPLKRPEPPTRIGIVRQPETGAKILFLEKTGFDVSKFGEVPESFQQLRARLREAERIGVERARLRDIIEFQRRLLEPEPPRQRVTDRRFRKLPEPEAPIIIEPKQPRVFTREGKPTTLDVGKLAELQLLQRRRMVFIEPEEVRPTIDLQKFGGVELRPTTEIRTIITPRVATRIPSPFITTKPISVFGDLQIPSDIQVSIQEQRQPLLLIQRQEAAQALESFSQILQAPIEDVLSGVKTQDRLASDLLKETISRTTQAQEQRRRTLLITDLRIPTTLIGEDAIREIPSEEPLLEEPVGFGLPRLRKRLKKKRVEMEGFKPQVKVKQKFVNVDKDIHSSRLSALDRSSRVADHTIAATFRAKKVKTLKELKSKRTGYFLGNANKWRDERRSFKGVPKGKLPIDTFIERRSKRLDTKGEVDEITVAKFLARERKRRSKRRERSGSFLDSIGFPKISKRRFSIL